MYQPIHEIMRIFVILGIAILVFSSKSYADPKAKSQSNQMNTDAMWLAESVPELPTGVTHLSYRSESMQREVGYCIYLPPTYSSLTTRLYPVIYHLHGAGGNECKSIYSASVLHEGILAGRWPELIMVFPNGGRSTMYQDSENRQFMAETTLIHELIPLVDKTYRTVSDRKGRCIEGFSMGGRGSTHIVMKYPQMFCSLFNQSGNVYHVSALARLPNDYLGSDPVRLEANDPYLNLKKNVAYVRQHVRIQVACGTSDPDHLITVREFHTALTGLAVPHEYFEVEGLDHNQKKMIDGRKEHWFDFHIESLKSAGATLHFVK